MIVDDLSYSRRIDLPPGEIVIWEPLQFAEGGQQSLIGSGMDQTTLICRGDYESAITADGLRNLTIANLTLKVNAANRPELMSRAMGIWLRACSGCEVSNVRVTGTIGGDRGEAIGICIGGDHNRVIGCELIDLGKAENPDGTGKGLASDGAYLMGVGNIIRGCKALRCSDTAMVLEGSEYSGIVDCESVDCGAGAAITCIGTGSLRGNYIDGLKITGWGATVTGCVSVGVINNAKGDLLDTRLNRIVIGGTPGAGPAISIRRVGKGMTRGLTLKDCVVRDAGTQGILLTGEHITVEGCDVSGTGWSGIQAEPGSLDIRLIGNRVGDPTAASAYPICVNGVPMAEILSSRNAMSRPIKYIPAPAPLPAT